MTVVLLWGAYIASRARMDPEIVRAWGKDHTGDCLHEFLDEEYHDFIRGQIDQCREQRAPVFSHSRFQWDRGRAVDTRRLLLPYRRDAATEEMVAVAEAVERLERRDPRKGEIVNLRYFAGLTAEETASAMGISLGTVEREWRFIKAWLKDALG